MQLLIDAINIRAGGGLTHLQEILSEENYTDNSFEKIHLVTLLDLSAKIQNKKIYIHKLSFTKFERALYLFYPYKILRRYLNLAEINLIFSLLGKFNKVGIKRLFLSPKPNSP